MSAYPTASSNMVPGTPVWRRRASPPPGSPRISRTGGPCILRSGFVRCAAPDIGDPSSLFLKRILDLLSGERLRTLRRRQDRGGTEEIMRHTLVLLARDLDLRLFQCLLQHCPIAPQRVDLGVDDGDRR